MKIGIWIDYREANVISLKGNNEIIKTIDSDINPARPRGGSHSKLPWGDTDKISEKHFLEKRKQQERAYFEKIIKIIAKADELYIFGPAEAKQGLLKAIKLEKSFKPHLRGIETADSMTEKQKLAQVKIFFEGISS